MKHTISVLVENKPRVLARVSGLFGRRGFNIHSLAVGPTEDPQVSRMTIVVDLPSQPVEQVVKQLYKLVNVLKVNELDPKASVERELMLVKVSTTPETRARVIELADLFKANVVDVAPRTITVEVTGSPEKLHSFEDLVSEYGIAELVKTGRVALARGSQSVKGRRLRAVG